MKRFIMAATVAVAFIPTQSMAMTDAECVSAWSTADANKDGYISVDEGARYHAAMRVANKPVADGKLNQTDFIANCKAGLFDARRADAGAPLKGANSFTENQAKDRAMAHGFSNVSQLAKDGDGIWRGTAQLDGKPIKIAIDYKGNVVASN